MSKTLKKMMILSLSALMPLSALADFDCRSTLPNCAELGFVHTAEGCANLLRLKCPFGDAYFCSKEASCDYTAGAYEVQPTGSTGSSSNGCFYPTGCDEDGGYVNSNTTASSFFTNTGTLYPFTIGHGEGDASCYQVTGCKNSVPYSTWVSENYASWFTEEDTYEIGAYKCVRVDTCASGKENASDCHEYTQSISNAKTVNGTTCGTCVKDCDESSGYFPEEDDCIYDQTYPTRAVCRKVDECWVFDHYEEENCDQYTSNTYTKWIVNQGATYNAQANITACKNEFGLYPSTTTATCGGTTYRQCVTPTCAQAMGDTDYTASYPGNKTSISSFYEKVTNAGGYTGLTCYNRENTKEWTDMTISNSVDCTISSNQSSYQVKAYYAYDDDFEGSSYACQAIYESTTYTKAILASGFYFTTSGTVFGNEEETFTRGVCSKTISGVTYETQVETTARSSALNKVALILSTNTNANGFTFRTMPLYVYECCADRGYHLSDMGDEGYYYLSGDSVKLNQNGSVYTVQGCGNYHNY